MTYEEFLAELLEDAPDAATVPAIIACLTDPQGVDPEILAKISPEDLNEAVFWRLRSGTHEEYEHRLVCSGLELLARRDFAFDYVFVSELMTSHAFDKRCAMLAIEALLRHDAACQDEACLHLGMVGRLGIWYTKRVRSAALMKSLIEDQAASRVQTYLTAMRAELEVESTHEEPA